MVSFQVKQLIDPTESQIQETIDIFTDVFYGSTGNIKASLGGDWSLLREFMAASVRASLLAGYVNVVTIGNGLNEEIVSVGCWLGNGVQLFGSEEQRALGYNAWFEKLSDETKHWFTKDYPEQAAKLTGSHFTKEEWAKCWWCYLLATHAKHQGKGYATAIIQAMFKKAKAEGTLIGLSTSPEVNVKKYLSMGMKRRGKGGLIHSPTGDFWRCVHILIGRTLGPL